MPWSTPQAQGCIKTFLVGGKQGVIGSSNSASSCAVVRGIAHGRSRNNTGDKACQGERQDALEESHVATPALACYAAAEYAAMMVVVFDASLANAAVMRVVNK